MATTEGKETSLSTATTSTSSITTATNLLDRSDTAPLASNDNERQPSSIDIKHESRVNSKRLVEELTKRQQQSIPILSRVCRSYIEPSNSNIKQIDATTSSRVHNSRFTNSQQIEPNTNQNNHAIDEQVVTSRNVIININNHRNQVTSLLPVPLRTNSNNHNSANNSIDINSDQQQPSTSQTLKQKNKLTKSNNPDRDETTSATKNDNLSDDGIKINQNVNVIGQFSQLEMVLPKRDQDNNITDTPVAKTSNTSLISQPASSQVKPTNQNFQGDQSKELSREKIKFRKSNQQQNIKHINFGQVVSFPASSSASSSCDDQKSQITALGTNQTQQIRLDIDSCEEQEEKYIRSHDRDQLSDNQQQQQQKQKSQSYSSSTNIEEVTDEDKGIRDTKEQITDTNVSLIKQDNRIRNATSPVDTANNTNNISSDSNSNSSNSNSIDDANKEQHPITVEPEQIASFGSTPALVKRAPSILNRGEHNSKPRNIASGEQNQVANGGSSLNFSNNYQQRRRPLQDSIKSNSNTYSDRLNRNNALSKSYSNINNYLSNSNNNNFDRQYKQHQRHNSISYYSRPVDSTNQQSVRYHGYSNISNLFPSLPSSINNQHQNSYIRSYPSAHGGGGNSNSNSTGNSVQAVATSSASKVNRVTNTLKSLLPSMAASTSPATSGQLNKRTTISSASTTGLHRTNSTGSQSMTPSPISRYQSPTATTPATTVSPSLNVVHRLDRPTTAYSSYSSPMASRRILSRPSSATSMYKRSPSLSSIPGFDPSCPVHGYYSNSNYNLASDDYYLHSNYYSQPSSKYYGVRHATPFGSLRSSLAPANEQLRKILGSQPHLKPVHLHPQWAISSPFVHLQQGPIRSRYSPTDDDLIIPDTKPEFIPYNKLEDSQAIRAVDFHPNGEVYAIGSNSRTLRICSYPADHELRHLDSDHIATTPRILFKFLQVHRGSIYCVAFNTTGDLIATGSNDQTIHVVRYNSITHCPEGDEYKLTMHDGTIRDLCFIDDHTNGTSLLISAGGGDNKIYVTDCDTITPFQSMAGHSAPVLSLHTWGGANFVSGSTDRTIRFWDLRTRGCTSIISAPSLLNSGKGPGAPVCAVRVDPTGKVLISGHNDATCMIYDIRGGRVVQTFKPHQDEIRSVSFSPKAYYLLTAGYDGRVVLTDLQGDLTAPLPSVCVAESDDKIVQAKWHPTDFTFVTTSANKTATLWALPNN